MTTEWKDLDVEYDNASQVVTLSKGGRSLHLQTFTEAQFQKLQAIAERIYAEKRRTRANKQRAR